HSVTRASHLDDHGRARHCDRLVYLRGEPQSDRRADTRHATRPADQLARRTPPSSGCEAWCAAGAGFGQSLDAHPARYRIGLTVNDIRCHPKAALLDELDDGDNVGSRELRV